MEHRGMSTTQLGALIGSKGAASEILNAKRGISKMHMARLVAHFRANARAICVPSRGFNACSHPLP
jgi:antitoxin component HigA of HigAB toxin-antitoxin module